MSKCVELTAVYDDGTVERWEGDAADRAMGEFESGASAMVEERCCSRKEIAEVEANIKPQTVTHPLRRVTEARGRYQADDESDVQVIVNEESRYVYLDDLLPGPVVEDGARVYSLRITVEATKVEGGKR